MIKLDQIKEKIVESQNISKEEVDQKIKAKLEELSGLISEEGAAHIIANDLGVDILKTDGVVQIKDLMPGMKDVSVNARVIRKYDVREFNRQSGETGKVAKALIGDESGITMLVFWDNKTKHFEELKEKDIANFSSLNVRDNNSRTEVHLSPQSEVKINPEGVDIKAPTIQEATPKKIADIKKEDNMVEVVATVVQVFDIKFFEKGDETGMVLNMFIDDGTDNMRAVVWKERIVDFTGLSEQELLKFKENTEEFEKIKTDLLGKIYKLKGKVSFNEMFSRLELVINKVSEPDPKEEIKKAKEQEQTDKSSKEEPKKQSEDEDLDEDILSLEDLDDI